MIHVRKRKEHCTANNKQTTEDCVQICTNTNATKPGSDPMLLNPLGRFGESKSKTVPNGWNSKRHISRKGVSNGIMFKFFKEKIKPK